VINMRRLLALPALFLLLVACAAGASPPTSAAGGWTGQIGIPGAPLDVGIRLTPDGDALRGTIDIPAQGVEDLPLAEVRLDGADLSFRLPDAPGDAGFRGTVEPGGTRIPGTFTQFGQPYPLVLAPGAAPGRPQEPAPPFPYRSEEVTYAGGGVDLAGTLTLPDGPGPFTALALVTGSGAQDRDETLLGHKPFLLLADTLTRAGYAVLRVDDRGVGGSGGVLSEAGFDALTDDVVAGVEYLRSRPEIAPERIGLLGHSEGGYLVPLAAQHTDIAFALLMAGPAAPGADVLVEQNRLLLQAAGAAPEAVESQVEYVRELIELLRAQEYGDARALAAQQIAAQTADLPPGQRPTSGQLDVQAAASATPVYRAFVVHEPAPSLRSLDVPALALFGGRDLQVSPAQNEPLMRDLLAGSPDATVRTLPDVNHVLQPAVTGGPEEYGTIETTIDPEVLDLLRDWLAQRFPA
jgi:alpha-beta hydrolase superfamily lysophospholipase